MPYMAFQKYENGDFRSQIKQNGEGYKKILGMVLKLISFFRYLSKQI